ncbi:hypothetical protein GCM10028833_19280 [Glycomyces tarimensis]
MVGEPVPAHDDRAVSGCQRGEVQSVGGDDDLRELHRIIVVPQREYGMWHVVEGSFYSRCIESAPEMVFA